MNEADKGSIMALGNGERTSSRKRTRLFKEEENQVAWLVERKEDGDQSWEELVADDFNTFTDTSIALNMMRSQFPKSLKSQATLRPIVLRSQLYSSIQDRTQVDRELEGLKNERVLRLFKLNTGQNDQAIMLLEDYIEEVHDAKRRLAEIHPSDIDVFDWFQQSVLSLHHEVSISHSKLCELLSTAGKVKDLHVTLLINAGFLIRQLIDSDSYWFSIPNIGFLLKSLNQGRKEILSLLNRRKFKEILLSLLERKHLQRSKLDIRFHLRDLIGSGHLKIKETPSGPLVQLVKP